jgi:Protein of unknown function (DUF3302)
MLGFELDVWDYITFASLAFVGVAFIVLLYLILGLPGRLAIARNHPEAEAVNLMAWLGFLAVVPWVQALIWALKPTYVVDIRDLPPERRRETEAQIARLTPRRFRKRRHLRNRPNRDARPWSPDC